MGWSYRKSVNLGPFRVNISKSGIGYSLGGAGSAPESAPAAAITGRSASPERDCGILRRRRSRAALWPWPCCRE